MIEVNQVGKRWFICKGDGVDVEASRGTKTTFVLNPKDTKRAGYRCFDWVTKTYYTLTGKGARSKREEIEAAIEKFLEDKRLERFEDG